MVEGFACKMLFE